MVKNAKAKVLANCLRKNVNNYVMKFVKQYYRPQKPLAQVTYQQVYAV